PRTGEVSDPLKEHNGTIRTVRFLPPTTGSVPLIASAGAGDFVTRVWDARAGACLRGLTAHPDAVHGLVWLTEQTLLTGCDAGQIIGHDLRSPRAAWSYNLNDLSQPPRKGVCCLSLLPTASGGGMTVVAGCTGGYVMFFDASTGQVHASHQMHQDDVRSVCVEYTHTQQQTLLTASYDGTATVRGISHSSSILLDTPQILSAHADKVLSAIPIPGTPIAGRNSPPMDYLTTGADGKVMLWSSH
ncbi:WD40-repeat-containing domain protein, partial [Ochromonadaceae sp. CCMP2298]